MMPMSTGHATERGYKVEARHVGFIASHPIQLADGILTGEWREVAFSRGSNPCGRQPMNNPINHPSHYNFGKIEIIDAIEDWKLGFNLGNVVKYIARADYKENALVDLEKAAWYLNREIERRKNVSVVGCGKELATDGLAVTMTWSDRIEPATMSGILESDA